MVWLEIIVVLGAIFFGIRQGGIGIGLCGGLGLAILTLGFGLPMGSPPVDVILIIMTVVVAASALQAAGGMDYLVRLASNFMRRNPKYINIIAPIITWLMTIMAGTGFIVFSTLPVIAEVAKESGIRLPAHSLAQLSPHRLQFLAHQSVPQWQLCSLLWRLMASVLFR